MEHARGASLAASAVGVALGAVTFFAVSFISIFAYNPSSDPAAVAIVMLVVAIVVIGGASLRSRAALAGGMAMLALLLFGIIVGEPTALVAWPSLDPLSLLRHGGRSAVVATMTGAVLAAGLLSLLRARRGVSAHVDDYGALVAQR